VTDHFEGLAEFGVNHFQNIYKDLGSMNIGEILKLTTYFPSFVNEEETQFNDGRGL